MSYFRAASSEQDHLITAVIVMHGLKFFFVFALILRLLEPCFVEAQASPNDDSGRSGVRFVIHLVYFYHSTEELFDSRVTLFTSPLPHGVKLLFQSSF